MKKSDHHYITQFALKENVEDLFEPAFLDFLQKHSKHLLKGSKAEDGPIAIQRVKNWHFYKPADSTCLESFPGLKIANIEPSSRPRFKKLVKRLSTVLTPSTPSSFMKTAGRILHHIQDMSTPSHSLPIFHAPFSLWKEFPKYKDKFEEYSEEAIQNRLSLEKVKQIRLDRESTATKLMELYDETAQQTLSYLESDAAKITGRDAQGRDVTVSNTIFWNKPTTTDCPKGDKTGGWGTYGPHEKEFGKGFTVTPSYIGNVEGVQVDLENYIHIYDNLIAKMVADSLSALLLVQKVYKEAKDREPIGVGD